MHHEHHSGVLLAGQRQKSAKSTKRHQCLFDGYFWLSSQLLFMMPCSPSMGDETYVNTATFGGYSTQRQSSWIRDAHIRDCVHPWKMPLFFLAVYGWPNLDLVVFAFIYIPRHTLVHFSGEEAADKMEVCFPLHHNHLSSLAALHLPGCVAVQARPA